ncbi:hypothetical protein RJ640_028407 [Escallonia rubra]|uniref:Bet v I/Major latex protein domain-containing protein n=1 Tax=Escallonia rubra TaxID=112253 RepID=A0AA88QXZ4_9ASTE|nr:hypothetical protein RJ640_028407 [Escallonia rubra]
MEVDVPATESWKLYLAKVEIVEEKFTRVDNEKMVKETEETERGHLDYGFTLYRIRFECIPKTKKIHASLEQQSSIQSRKRPLIILEKLLLQEAQIS